MHLVFIGAHPDDETFVSGTIGKYTHRFRELGRKTGARYYEAFISRSGRKYAHEMPPSSR